MPCSLLLCLPGGATGKVRKRYAILQKILLVEESNRLRRECNFSLRKAGEELGAPFSVLSRWTKDIENLRASSRANRKAGHRKAILDGSEGQLASIEEELLQWVFARREQGINVKHMLISFKASALLRATFGDKSFNAKLKAVTRFMKKHDYVYRRATN
jgi:hypothetical protein